MTLADQGKFRESNTRALEYFGWTNLDLQAPADPRPCHAGQLAGLPR
jgi:hypothetical protein